MLVLGHMGIGAKLARPWTKGLRLRWVLLGTLLPDLVDKPIYYALSWASGLQGADLGLISSTRTLGHTGILLILLTLLTLASRSRALAAISIGVATHLLLDNISDRILGNLPSSAYQALIFPLGGLEFGVQPPGGLSGHFLGHVNPYILITESLGFLFLTWGYWRKERRLEIHSAFRERIHERLRRWRRR